jgi:hypothetical protein
MFVVKVNGGLYDGQTILTDGWIPFSASTSQMMSLGLSIAKFDDLADAQDFVVNQDSRVRHGDYGIGAELVIDEINGDIMYERE